MTKTKYAGIIVYIFTIVATALLLIIDPVGLNAKALVLPFIALLFISALGFSYPLASKNSSKPITLVGTIMLAILFTFIGFFAIAGVAWFVAVSNT